MKFILNLAYNTFRISWFSPTSEIFMSHCFVCYYMQSKGETILLQIWLFYNIGFITLKFDLTFINKMLMCLLLNKKKIENHISLTSCTRLYCSTIFCPVWSCLVRFNIKIFVYTFFFLQNKQRKKSIMLFRLIIRPWRLDRDYCITAWHHF